MAKKPTTKKKNTPSALKKKKTQTSSVASHPPYFQMIKEAILALQERNGSSPYAIAKYMEEKHRGLLPANFRKLLARQLKNLTRDGKLVKVKFSFKLSPHEKMVARKFEKLAKPVSVVPAKRKTAVAAKKPSVVTPKKRSAVVKSGKKAAVGKKVKMAATVKPKQLKSIKSPAAKRARKASA